MAWIIQDGQLTNTDFIALPDKPFHGDSPFTMWRIEPSKNKGIPFSPLHLPIPGENLTCYIGDTPVTALYIGDITATALL